jgi:hypothetical protein
MGDPFDLRDETAYGRWREKKMTTCPVSAAELTVEVAGLDALGARERGAIAERCQKTNMAIYACRAGGTADPAAMRTFAAGFGLRRFDRHLCSDDCGVSELAVAATGGRRSYAPYSDRGLSWHTDGYYNEPSAKIRAVLLHCVQAAESGGENLLLDHEIAYIHLRDENPGYIEALMHPQAMIIPANREGDTEIRPARSGPVFSVDPATGALHMRYSARARNIIWRDDPATRAAVACLNEFLTDPDGPAIGCRLSPGQGIISNNVLHNRAAFRDGPQRRRLVYRMRFYDRIAETDAVGALHG